MGGLIITKREDDLLTSSQVAEMLGLDHPRDVRRIPRKDLPYSKRPRVKRWYRVEDVLTYKAKLDEVKD